MRTWIEIQLDVLFARDADGRLVATRDPAPRPAPRLFLSRSPERTIWAVRADVDAPTRRALDAVCAAEPPPGTLHADGSPLCREAVLALLAPVASEWRGPAYVLPDELPHDPRARVVTGRDAHLWREAFPWLGDCFDAVAPVAIAFADGRAASVCHSPRGRTSAAAEAGVETLAAFRDRGLATAAVACWARAVQRSGRAALYSTSWQNAASQRVAQRLGARLHGENWHLH
ncbi:MAG: GNAT family N-acetyltransferase [Proteobacteria bacterium]|nr:MAG: GNAT family N-acetyltransferase [Pseudomonadota bacterium]